MTGLRGASVAVPGNRGLVAAISGSSDARPQIERLAAEVEKGKVLVTIDVTKRRTAIDCEAFLERHGAHHIGVV